MAEWSRQDVCRSQYTIRPERIFLTGAAAAGEATPQLLAQPCAEPTSYARAFDTEDARLNDIYKALAALLDDDKRKTLRDDTLRRQFPLVIERTEAA